jgi:uncharacterized protein YcgI (DUF1989 family)
VVLSEGDRLVIESPTGEQVADVFAVASADRLERLSAGRTIDYASSIFMSTGTKVYSNRSNVMFLVEDDSAGRHDMLLSPCSQEMFEKLYGVVGHHPSCLENLSLALAPYGVGPDAITDSLNVFMTVDVDAHTGEVTVGIPSSVPGSRFVLRAQMDLVVGITACSAELTNNGSFKPIDVEIVR